jgi:3-deoxy-D-manno-octulosonate 8-phosphate phosphatase (KDO 8-P phosphatase)
VSKIKVKPEKFILDVDGVLNDGCFYYSKDGKVLKKFGAHDNDGIKMLKHLIKIEFYTADKNGFEINKKRIEDLGFNLNFITEETRFKKICIDQNPNKIIYMGDGIHDVKILEKVLCGISPKSARKEAKKASDYVTESEAGNGAVLDAVIFIKKKFFNK